MVKTFYILNFDYFWSDRILKFVILQVYNIGLQRYKEKKEFVAKPKFLGALQSTPPFFLQVFLLYSEIIITK